MSTKVEIDAAFLARHNTLSERFYAMKQAGQIVPALQALFDKAHGYLVLTHERAIRLLGAEGEGDYYVDEVRDDDGMLIKIGSRLRSQEIAEALAGAFRLTPAEIAEVRRRWEASLV